MMNTKLNKLIAFHPHIDEKNKVVIKMIVHIIKMYNS
jgi:hypothetical protein